MNIGYLVITLCVDLSILVIELFAPSVCRVLPVLLGRPLPGHLVEYPLVLAEAVWLLVMGTYGKIVWQLGFQLGECYSHGGISYRGVVGLLLTLRHLGWLIFRLPVSSLMNDC